MKGHLLGEELLAALPEALRACLAAERWWEDERCGVTLIRALSELEVPSRCSSYRRIDGPASPRWDWQGHALVHESSILQSGVNLFGPVIVGPGCEIGPNATVFGPTIIEGDSYLGPNVDVRRCLLMAGAEVAHMSFLAHSVVGRDVALGAFFCSAVRNLARGTVHLLEAGALVDTGERRLGCVIADGVETSVQTTVMPGRRLLHGARTAPGSVVMRNLESNTMRDHAASEGAGGAGLPG